MYIIIIYIIIMYIITYSYPLLFHTSSVQKKMENDLLIPTIEDDRRGRRKVSIIEEKGTLENGEPFVQQYLMGQFLGKGAFARCYEFQNTTTKKVFAAKIIPKSTLSRKKNSGKLKFEIEVLRSMHHPNIVGFESSFEDKNNVYILLELCQHNTLKHLLKQRKKITELEARCYLVQIIAGLKHIHGNNIIHRDLKLNNLFLSSNMEIKIGDFGLATKIEYPGQRRMTICGTPNYISPEMINGRSGHSYEVDIWALGVILYNMITGKQPFETPQEQTTYHKIKHLDYSFPDNVHISKEAKDLIQKILVLEKVKRPSLNQILGHPFFYSVKGIPKLLSISTLFYPPPEKYIKYFETGIIYPEEVQLVLTHTKSIIDQSPELHKTKFREKSISEQTPFSYNKYSIFVKKWVDLSKQYGMGYILSNNLLGVYFNDSSKIVMDFNGKDFYYIGSSKKEALSIETKYSLEFVPESLREKITILSLFRKFLNCDISIILENASVKLFSEII